MSAYQRLLVAVDLTEEAEQVLEKAVTLAKEQNAGLAIIHVVEPVGYAYGGDIPMDLTELQAQLEDSAKRKLREYGERFGVPEDDQIVAIGRPESEIHRISEEQGFDLVVVGSHGRHGIQLLLGSTANGVLHGAETDVLAVRIHRETS